VGKSSKALGAARRIAEAVARQGAQAVALVGSYATGTAIADSDLDLAVVGDGPHYQLEVHDGLLVSLGWANAEEQRRRLYDPAYLGTHVPGWRRAVALHDPEGLAASIKQEALDWSWNVVDASCNAWVAEKLTGYSEEVVRLRRSLRAGDQTTAAIQRSLLAVHLAPIMAIHRRLLYGSENVLWEVVSEEMGHPWAEAQRAALNLNEGGFEASCRAALELFALAANELRPLLDEHQQAVLDLTAFE
jgi:hypothetical protein